MVYHTPIALKLHSFGLQRVQDPNWTGLQLFYALKCPIRTEGFLQKFEKDGFLFWLGNLLFDEYMRTDDYIENIQSEYLIWYLEDYCEFLRCHQATAALKSLTRLEKKLENINDLYSNDENKYFRVIESDKTREKLFALHTKVRDWNVELIDSVSSAYAANYADRVFHDRELCGYLSQLIVSTGFDGMDSPHDTEPKQWMDRATIPAWARDLVVVRDRGRCALRRRHYIGIRGR